MAGAKAVSGGLVYGKVVVRYRVFGETHSKLKTWLGVCAGLQDGRLILEVNPLNLT